MKQMFVFLTLAPLFFGAASPLDAIAPETSGSRDAFTQHSMQNYVFFTLNRECIREANFLEND